ncbi:MAG: FG-GAP repeat domain-containing protein, partial [Gemmatimonadota bacterium]
MRIAIRHIATACTLAIAAGGAVFTGCGGDDDAPPLFERLPPERTGVTFENELPEEPELNILNYLNYYNGGGVAVGDIDNDGLPDLYFTSNLGPDRLYRNRGDYRFEDITERAGVGENGGWTTGVTMADVNGDGHLDIYVSAVSHLAARGRNVLYINDGDLGFTDMTDAYGLGHVGYSTQAAFFDYDLDGDLDAYLLNHSTHEERGDSFSPQRETH